jgi:hypothetical protein
MQRLRVVVVVLLALGGAACGIKGSPRPPEEPPAPSSETQPPPAETQPPATQPRGPLPSSIPPPDAGTP